MIAIVPSASRPGVQHAVVIDAEQVLCTCEGWRIRQQCRHLSAVLPTVAECPACKGTVTHLPGVVACDRCEWAAL